MHGAAAASEADESQGSTNQRCPLSIHESCSSANEKSVPERHGCLGGLQRISYPDNSGAATKKFFFVLLPAEFFEFADFDGGGALTSEAQMA
jgi:hypothetical protein